MTPQFRGAEKGLIRFFYMRKIRKNPTHAFTLPELHEHFCNAANTKYPMSRDALQIVLGSLTKNGILASEGPYIYLSKKGQELAESLENKIGKVEG